VKTSRFTRLTVVGLLLASAVLVALWMTRWRAPAPGQAAGQRAGSPADSPAASVLLITIDTLRADAVGAYGAAGAETPTLDRLAGDGLLFENAYSVAPITLVAHTSLLTGVYPPVHGVRNNGIHALAGSWTTLPERVAGQGVRTAAVVGATVLDRRYGLDQGFEVYDDDLRAERSSAAAVDRPAGAVTEAAIRWLAGVGSDERFFLWVHYFDPHAPYAPPEPFRSRFAEHPYDGEIAYVDSEIGRLLRQQRLAGDDRLAVIVVGDHGESLGEHGEQTHGMLAYDATLRVPLIIRPPGGRRGERSRQAVDQVDLLPTVLAMMRIAGGGKLPGRDLLASGGELAPRPLYAETYVPFYTYGWAKLRSLRVGAMKYIEAPRPELYAYRDDPGEEHDLFTTERRTAGELGAELERLFPAAADGEAEALVPDREARAQLRALGYLGSLGDGAAAGGPARDPKEMMPVHLEMETANEQLLAGQSAAAIRSYRQALEADPNNLRALSDLATAQATSGRLEEGIRTLERAIDVAPANAQLHLQRAAFSEEQGDAEGALRHLDLALELAPALLEARLEKTAYLGRLGRLDEAAALAAETLSRYPDDAEANVLYAQLVELPRGDLAGAESRLRGAVARDPYLAAAWRALVGLLERRGQTAAAREAVAAGLARLPGDAGLRADLGRLGTGGSAPNGSAPNGTGPRPRQTAADGALGDRNRRAIEAYRGGDRAAAVAMLQALLDEHPDYSPGWVNLSWLALDREDWAAAAQYARRALDVDPTLTRAWENLGRAREAQGHGGEAEQAYRQAVAQDADYWQARLRLAVLLLQSGREDEASSELSQVESRAADEPEARFQLARIFEARGDAARARLNYEAVVRLAPPGEPLARSARERLRVGF